MSDWLQTNRAMWDERVPIHVAGDFYDVEGFLAGASRLRAFEPGELGDVTGCSLAHPQCHFGLDTLLLHEQDHTLYPRWPFLERAADGTYRLPAGTPSLPLMYSLLAVAA